MFQVKYNFQAAGKKILQELKAFSFHQNLRYKNPHPKTPTKGFTYPKLLLGILSSIYHIIIKYRKASISEPIYISSLLQ